MKMPIKQDNAGRNQENERLRKSINQILKKTESRDLLERIYKYVKCIYIYRT